MASLRAVLAHVIYDMAKKIGGFVCWTSSLLIEQRVAVGSREHATRGCALHNQMLEVLQLAEHIETACNDRRRSSAANRTRLSDLGVFR